MAIRARRSTLLPQRARPPPLAVELGSGPGPGRQDRLSICNHPPGGDSQSPSGIVAYEPERATDRSVVPITECKPKMASVATRQSMPVLRGEFVDQASPHGVIERINPFRLGLPACIAIYADDFESSPRTIDPTNQGARDARL